MATVWSLATISCMFTRSYGQLLAARAVVGLGEAGYGSVGAALIASHFPARMRGALLAGFFASASVGSVLGVMLGGLIAARWGWQAAFGVVGFPGLVLALLYLKVRDYQTVALTPALEPSDAVDRRAPRGTSSRVAGPLAHHAVGVHRRRGAADRGVGDVVVAAELPQPRARHRAGAGRRCKAALVVLCRRRRQRGLGRAGRPRRRAPAAPQAVAMALLCVATIAGAGARPSRPRLGLALTAPVAVRADRCSAAS